MTASDQETIQAVLNGYYDAFGRDSAVSASFFCEPALVVFPNQLVRLDSRADVESFYEKYVASLKPSGLSHSRLGEHHIKLLNSTTALCSVVSIRVKVDGTEIERSGFTYLLHKTDAAWKIYELIGTDLDKLIGVN
jgi:ketosteroid isomerase-like protein